MNETGLRNFEVRAVDWDHLSYENGSLIGHIFVPKGKGRKKRTVPFPVDVWLLLNVLKMNVEETHGSEAVADDAPVFVKENGQRMTEDTMRMLFNRLSERAGKILFPDDEKKAQAYHVTPHMLRHTYAIQSIKRGLHITVLQKFMGHSDVKTTMGYLRFTEDDGLGDLYIKTLRNGAARVGATNEFGLV